MIFSGLNVVYFSLLNQGIANETVFINEYTKSIFRLYKIEYVNKKQSANHSINSSDSDYVFIEKKSILSYSSLSDIQSRYMQQHISSSIFLYDSYSKRSDEHASSSIFLYDSYSPRESEQLLSSSIFLYDSYSSRSDEHLDIKCNLIFSENIKRKISSLIDVSMLSSDFVKSSIQRTKYNLSIENKSILSPQGINHIPSSLNIYSSTTNLKNPKSFYRLKLNDSQHLKSSLNNKIDTKRELGNIDMPESFLRDSQGLLNYLYDSETRIPQERDKNNILILAYGGTYEVSAVKPPKSPISISLYGINQIRSETFKSLKNSISINQSYSQLSYLGNVDNFTSLLECFLLSEETNYIDSTNRISNVEHAITDSKKVLAKFSLYSGDSIVDINKNFTFTSLNAGLLKKDTKNIKSNFQIESSSFIKQVNTLKANYEIENSDNVPYYQSAKKYTKLSDSNLYIPYNQIEIKNYLLPFGLEKIEDRKAKTVLEVFDSFIKNNIKKSFSEISATDSELIKKHLRVNGTLLVYNLSHKISNIDKGTSKIGIDDQCSHIFSVVAKIDSDMITIDNNQIFIDMV